MRKFYSNKKILITGGNGYLASSIIRLLSGVPCRIQRLDRKGSQWNEAEVSTGTEVQNVEADIRNIAEWRSLLLDVDIVFHLAAQTSVHVANSNPVEDAHINVFPMLHMLETCKKEGVLPVIIFSSTSTVTGLPKSLPVDEKHPDNPLTMYEVHKSMSESYLKFYTNEGVAKGVILRLTNVYGPGPRSSSADRGVLNQMIRKALANEALTVYGKGDFLRDYIYVRDVARAFLFAAAGHQSLQGRHFVIGTGVGTTITDAFNMVSQRVALRTGKKTPVVHVDPPKIFSPIEARNFVADSNEFIRLARWKPEVGLVRGVDLTIDSYMGR